MYQIVNQTSVRHLPTGTVFPLPPGESFGHDYQRWLDAGNTPLPAQQPQHPTPHDLDRERYMLRAKAKDELLAEMNAASMELVRTGVWTEADLISLMTDPQIKQAIDLINSLSFDFAASALMAVTNPLMTPEIKAEWAARLQAHFYLEAPAA